MIDDTVRRLGGVPARAWLDPYAIGFIVSLVTLVAGSLRNHGPHGIGFVQVDCWHRLTGVRDGGLGERICLLSVGNDADFMRGCHDARAYFLHRRESGDCLTGAVPPVGTPWDEASPVGTEVADHVWATTIERHLGAAHGLEFLGDEAVLADHDAHRTG